MRFSNFIILLFSNIALCSPISDILSDNGKKVEQAIKNIDAAVQDLGTTVKNYEGGSLRPF
jgi:hypothetical protein